MRHSTASEMLNGGAHLNTVGSVLGHLSPVSTRRYAHLVVGTLSAAVKLVGKKSPTMANKKAA
ncbi:Phage integrase family protein [Variovorax sp. PDC80]|uniref:tyrosine-type recombinase/integrase n=1 Tax=Variovorax sp. PDC80 TaxID=1882827 RepID=UPI0008E476E3|nr:tyrosine-type recombinase/integrase [Variovorax sp. PDC80]SFO29358.1 Phage integrase family protein [Variovorax sp. PDC80]